MILPRNKSRASCVYPRSVDVWASLLSQYIPTHEITRRCLHQHNTGTSFHLYRLCIQILYTGFIHRVGTCFILCLGQARNTPFLLFVLLFPSIANGGLFVHIISIHGRALAINGNDENTAEQGILTRPSSEGLLLPTITPTEWKNTRHVLNDRDGV